MTGVVARSFKGPRLEAPNESVFATIYSPGVYIRRVQALGLPAMSAEAQSRIRRLLSQSPSQHIERLLVRASTQMEFAKAFAAALPETDTLGWTEAIERALGMFDGYDPQSGASALAATISRMEEELSAIAEKAKTYTIHCVGHGHIDMNWMWSWPETVSTTHDTFASILSLMDQYPEFTYSQSQASVYALIEKYHPAMFERIRERVREGRWEITAVHWVEGDKNLASGESLARHMLYTRRYFQEKFGLAPEDIEVDWEPDTFGHANTTPGILRQGGAKYYYSCRPGGGFGHARVGGPRPRLFWWQSPDGSRVLVNRESTWYNSYVNIGYNIALPLCGFVQETGLSDWLNVYGVGNHGGGPTRDEIEYYIEMNTWPVYPNVVFGTSQEWFRKVEADIAARKLHLPVLKHELNFEFTGCYTSQSAIKRANRFGENYLEEAETLAAIRSRLGGDYGYPREMLRDGWLNVLFNHFHDILPGSGVVDTREHALGLFQEVGAITGSVKREVGVWLASQIDTLSLLPDTPAANDERTRA
jgi:alpha-mannosidase